MTVEDNEDQETSIEYELSIRAVESEERKVYVAGEGTTGMLVNVYIENVLIGDVKPDSNERWLLEADMELLPGTYTVRADLINEQDSQVVKRVSVDFLKESGQVVSLPVVEQGSSSESGEIDPALVKVGPPSAIIIKRGDNLWNISRKLYGSGFRYTTIYEANRDQIRDPDLIYPDQKFITPVVEEWNDG